MGWQRVGHDLATKRITSRSSLKEILKKVFTAEDIHHRWKPRNTERNTEEWKEWIMWASINGCWRYKAIVIYDGI